MKHFDQYTNIIAIKENSAGNDSVGDMWVETKSFNKETPISHILEWAKNCSGKLIITIDETDAKNDGLNF